MVRITVEALPILCFQCYGKSTKADIDMIRPYYERAIRSGKFIALSDARYASNDADQRRMWAGWLAEFNELDAQRRCIATVLMLDSALLRGALIALNWITPSQAPQHVVGPDAEALEECRSIVQKQALEVAASAWGKINLWLGESHQYRNQR